MPLHETGYSQGDDDEEIDIGADMEKTPSPEKTRKSVKFLNADDILVKKLKFKLFKLKQ